MLSSLLPRRSNESVTGGCMVKPLVQSHCKELRSMQLGTVTKCWAAYLKNAHGTLWRWQFTKKPEFGLAFHVLAKTGSVVITSFESGSCHKFWVNASGRCDKSLSGFVTVGNCKIACCHVQACVGSIQKIHRERKVPFHGLNKAFRPVYCCSLFTVMPVHSCDSAWKRSRLKFLSLPLMSFSKSGERVVTSFGSRKLPQILGQSNWALW